MQSCIKHSLIRIREAGIDFDWEILSLQIPVDQPPKQWMYLPALMLLGMVILMQRRRRAFTS